jgi:hypothetical protein
LLFYVPQCSCPKRHLRSLSRNNRPRHQKHLSRHKQVSRHSQGAQISNKRQKYLQISSIPLWLPSLSIQIL